MAKLVNVMLDKQSEAQSIIKKSEVDLKKKVDESERMNSLMVGRELKMIELKKKIMESKIDT